VELIPWLFIAFLPLLYMQTSSNPKTMILAIFSSIFLIILLSLDEENQSYAFSSFMTSWFGFSGGFAISLAIYGLFSTVVPEREFSGQVRSFFAGCARFMQGLEQRSPGTPAGNTLVSTSRKHWQGTLRQLQVWSSMINYRQVPGNDRQQTQALIESIEYLVLRLTSLVHVHQQSLDLPDVQLREQLVRIYDACIDSLQTISSALDEQRPVPDLPDTESLIRAVESREAELSQSVARNADVHTSTLRFMSVIAEMRSLAAAIQDCRDKANSLDWLAWNRSYF
jgi:hypothetical protein